MPGGVGGRVGRGEWDQLPHSCPAPMNLGVSFPELPLRSTSSEILTNGRWAGAAADGAGAPHAVICSPPLSSHPTLSSPFLGSHPSNCRNSCFDYQNLSCLTASSAAYKITLCVPCGALLWKWGPGTSSLSLKLGLEPARSVESLAGPSPMESVCT